MCVQASACVHAHVWTKCQHHNALHMFFLYHLGPKLSHCLVSSVQRPQPSRPAAMPRSQVAPVRPRAKNNPKKVTKKILKQKRHQGQATGKAASDNKRTAPSVIRGKRPASSVQGKTHIVAYTRTSSRTNVHGNSRPRQLAAIKAQAMRDGHNPNGLRIISEVLSGMTPLCGRTKFMGLLEDPKVKVIYVESTSRIARSSLVAEQIYQAAERTGTDIVVADNPSIFKRGATPEESLLRRMMRAVQELSLIHI